jgi:hypothetical protein
MTLQEVFRNIPGTYDFRSKFDCDRKDDTSMCDIKIIFNGREYTPFEASIIENRDEFPRLVTETYLNPLYYTPKSTAKLSITNVIFAPPATIVFWSDRTKTVVKCDISKEKYDPEKGLAMAISRKMLGDNKREYYNAFLHWLKKYKKDQPYVTKPIEVNPGEWLENL